ncbi:MAG TPA: sugar ABC transporter substrate-binding protein [Desertimonas sp.]|nr:sugar ABC transporter substrate-binding protein [Desertimonas sp.]
MNTRRLATLLIPLTLATAVVACGSDDDDDDAGAATSGAPAAPATTGATGTTAAASGEAVKIGFITKFPVDFYDTMVDAAKTWNEDHPEVELIFAQGASGTDDEGEIAAIESMITQGVQAIAITPTSPNVQDALQKAVDGGIKVVLIDNDIPDWDAKTSVVATDNKAGGVLAGEYLAGQLAEGDTIAILEGVAGAPSLVDRVTGFQEGLGDGFDIVASLPTDCDQTKGLDAAQDILTANPDVTAIYGACGPPIIGAIEAAQAAGSSVVLVGFDAGPDEVAAIVAGDQLASVAQVPAKMGSMGAQAALDAVNGVDVPANIDTGTEMVTADNAAEFGG